MKQILLVVFQYEGVDKICILGRLGLERLNPNPLIYFSVARVISFAGRGHSN